MGRSSRRRFSIGEALNAPFVLVKRRPLAVFAWGLMRFALAGLTLAAMAPFYIELLNSTRTEVEPDFQMLMSMQAGMYGISLVGAVIGLMVATAAMRATWAKRGDGFAFLRLGMDELRVAVAAIAIGGGVYMGLILLAVVGLALGLALSSLGEQVVIPVMVAYGGFAVLLAIWVLARVILIVPVSLLDRNFAFERGWALGRGQAARLAVTGFLAWVILIVVQTVFFAIAAGILFLVAQASGVTWPGGTGPDFSETTPTVAELTALARPFLIPAAILAIPAILLTGFYHAMFSAPLASAARQLSDSDAPSAPVVIDPYDDGLSPILPAAAVVATEAVHAESDHVEHDHAEPGLHTETDVAADLTDHAADGPAHEDIRGGEADAPHPVEGDDHHDESHPKPGDGH